MPGRTSVIDISGGFEETILQLAKHLGTSVLRRQIFTAIYGRGTKPRSLKQIMHGQKINSSRTQQVQNELDHLAKHHLITKIDNDGSVLDGSRKLYEKEEHIRANKKLIIKLADNKKTAAKIPTKRRPTGTRSVSVNSIPRHFKRKSPLKVLYLTSNPIQGSPLRVDAEFRKVQEEIRGSRYRENIELYHKPASDLESLMGGLNDHTPQLVHFSGHGSSDAIVSDKGLVGEPSSKFLSFRLLGRALDATDNKPLVVVLNACKSKGAGKHVVRPGRVAIVMRNSISDLAATAFATKFYAGLAAGQSVMSAFKQGVVAIEAVSINEVATPELLKGDGANPARMVLV